MISVCGIDPGASGGIAIKYSQDEVVYFNMTNKTEVDIWEWFIGQKTPDVIYLEQVHSMPKQGVSSVWKFAQNYGMLRGYIIARGISLIDVTPNKWQSTFPGVKLSQKQKKAVETEVSKIPNEKQAAKKKSLEYKIKKNNTKACSQLLFPQIEKITHAISDCLLITEYGYKERN
ncbi:MAG TPA: hypothetical protein DEG69_18320 [Flavobacteriaceae bacterium]|nr:hypothetical protein [Flavobacteriaceae bacterium]|tara:strand:- start:1425 stop:1946 length:522 start_codon:yes stop_codon:yes gene_type:complete